LAKNRRERKKKSTFRWVIIVSTWTFFLASIFALFTRYLVQSIPSLVISFIILIMIVLTGIIFDTVGTAVTAADEKPFHAKAAKKKYGAIKGMYLVRNAEQVANFCNDVVGDISGVVSGAIAAVIVINLVASGSSLNEIYVSILLTGFVSALTVGGKAVGKSLAINNSTEIVMFVARLMTTLQRLFIWRINRQR